MAVVGPTVPWGVCGGTSVADLDEEIMVVELHKSGINWAEPRDVEVDLDSIACQSRGMDSVHWLSAGGQVGERECPRRH